MMQVIEMAQSQTGSTVAKSSAAEADSCAWTAETLSPESLKVRLTEPALAELREMARDPMIYEADPINHAPALSKLPETLRILRRIRYQLDHGIGCAVLDRLPVDEWDERQSTFVAYHVSAMIGRPIEQKWKGARFYHVRDTGAQKGYGVRLSTTNFRFDLHTDGPWLKDLPETMSLTCLQQAEVGGASRLASLVTAHDRLRRQSPDLFSRLYRDFWWDRQAEHAPGERLCNRLPVFEIDARGMSCRFNESYIRNGYGLLDETLDSQGDEALEALRTELNRPENNIEFRMEQGQIQLLNNCLIAHGRTAFEDAPNAPEEAKRHMIRIWTRERGDIALEPSQPLL